MKKILSVLALLYLSLNLCQGQYTRTQYFDGKDTDPYSSVIFTKDTIKSNIWQIGDPDKTIFKKAATYPNALVTDTLKTYPINNNSAIFFGRRPYPWPSVDITAIQWKQKLDMDKKGDGGMVEFTLNGGKTWQNVFHNPFVYKFYGWDSSSLDTLKNGQYAFSGTDSNWKDIWLCFDNSLLRRYEDSVQFRFSFQSDSIDNKKEGWIIDNVIFHTTFLHTGTPDAVEQKEYLRAFPTNTNGIVNIQAQRLDQYHIIESMELMDANGRIVERFGLAPIKFYIDISNHPNGIYYLRVNTNLKSETLKLILSK